MSSVVRRSQAPGPDGLVSAYVSQEGFPEKALGALFERDDVLSKLDFLSVPDNSNLEPVSLTE